MTADFVKSALAGLANAMQLREFRTSWSWPASKVASYADVDARAGFASSPAKITVHQLSFEVPYTYRPTLTFELAT